MNRVKLLKKSLIISKIDHNTEIMKETNLKNAHIYCVIFQLKSQVYGPLLDRYIRLKYGYTRNSPSQCNGDAVKNVNVEIKTSLGGKYFKYFKNFNYVQLRPSHNISYYIFTAYYLSDVNVESEGELFIFKVPSNIVKKLINEYGKYAHGTKKNLGEITLDDLNKKSNTKEYALRPDYNKDLWCKLLPFRINENEL